MDIDAFASAHPGEWRLPEWLNRTHRLSGAEADEMVVLHQRAAAHRPHGLLELTAVFVAAGAGLRLGWAWIDPGPSLAGRAPGAAHCASLTEQSCHDEQMEELA